jgi:hypothetical protein
VRTIIAMLLVLGLAGGAWAADAGNVPCTDGEKGVSCSKAGEACGGKSEKAGCGQGQIGCEPQDAALSRHPVLGRMTFSDETKAKLLAMAAEYRAAVVTLAASYRTQVGNQKKALKAFQAKHEACTAAFEKKVVAVLDAAQAAQFTKASDVIRTAQGKARALYKTFTSTSGKNVAGRDKVKAELRAMFASLQKELDAVFAKPEDAKPALKPRPVAEEQPTGACCGKKGQK